MKKIIPVFFAALLFASFSRVSFNVKEERVEATDYYASITSDMKGDTLKTALYNIVKKNHIAYSYNSLEIAMRTTDRNWTLSPDPDDENPYMVLLYAEYNETNPQTWNKSQGSFGAGNSNYIWNKEHMWAKDNGISSGPGYSDLHHLRASDWKLNNTRSNFPYKNITGGKYSQDAFGQTTGSKVISKEGFEPIDQYKGDCARALFYMATRYMKADGGTSILSLTTGTDSSGGKWGYLDTLIEWHELDPVDEFELHRNGLVQDLQGNRNPYIDHPEYVRAVFKNEQMVEPKKLTNLVLTGTLTKTSYLEGEAFSTNGLTIAAYFDDDSTSVVTSSVTWNQTQLQKGTTSLTGTYKYGSTELSVSVSGLTVSALDRLEVSGTPTKTEYTVGEAFNPSGLTVNAIYENSQTVNVTNNIVWSTLTYGQTSVTGTYGSKTVTINGLTINQRVESEKIEITRSAFPATKDYAWHDWSVDSLQGKAYIYAGESKKIQMNGGKAGKALYNTSELSADLTSITVKLTSDNSGSRTIKAYADTVAMSNGNTNNASVDLGVKEIENSGEATWELTESGLKYFMIVIQTSSVCYIDKITLGVGGLPGPDQPDAPTPTPIPDPDPVDPTPTVDPTSDTPSETESKKGCGGNIVTTSVVLSALSFIGICLFLIKKQDKVL